MPQLLFLAAIGAGAWLGTRWVHNRVRQFSRDVENLKKAARQQQGQTGARRPPEDIAELKQDPVTGVYRVEK